MAVVISIRNLCWLPLMALILSLVSLQNMAQDAAPSADLALKNDARTILVLGDSISAGFGIPMQQGWVALLSKELQRNDAKTRVINASISGDTTQGGVSRLPELLAKHQPNLVIIELGGNDGLRGTPIQVITHNLTTLIQLSREAGSDILLAGMQIPPNYGRRYTQSFREIFPTLAQQHNTLLLPFILQKVVKKQGLMQADGIHPTAEAQPLILQSVLPEVTKWLENVPPA
ncbi:MAG: arylesterase [Saccharospirillaceae bacterium]|nr:arylesterase [Saccharospirillaceae bacterium]